MKKQMKKQMLTSVVLGLVVLTFANCGKRDDNRNDQIGPVDMAANCYFLQTNGSMMGGQQMIQPGATCSYNYSMLQSQGFSSIGMNGMNGGSMYNPNQNQYNQFNQFNQFNQYNQFNQNQANYWGAGAMAQQCSYGLQMVYSPSKGLGCVSANTITMSGQPVYYDLSRATNTFVAVSTLIPGFQPGQMQTQNMYQNQYQNQMQPYGYNPYGNGNMGTTSYTGMANSLIGVPPATQTNTAGNPVLRVCDATEPCPSAQHCRSPIGPHQPTSVGVCYF